MPPAVERSIQPDADNFQSNLFRQQALAQRKHVGIVVPAREAGTLGIPAKRAAHSFDAICRHRFAVSGTAEHNAAFGFAAGHGERNRSDDRAVAENAWIVLEHDPETAMGRAKADGDDFAWAERVASHPGVAAR